MTIKSVPLAFQQGKGKKEKFGARICQGKERVLADSETA